MTRVVCGCGRPVSIEGERFLCGCGNEVGSMDDGVAVVRPVAPYWGEIGQEAMTALLAASERSGWRQAVEGLSPGMRDNILNPDRAAFQDVLPIPDGSSVLDVGAGLGCIATELAAHHEVTALEGVRERARFIACRKRQDGLKNLTVLNADLGAVRFDQAQFDAVVVNGVLEWVGLFDLAVPPEEAQLRFLRNLRRALKPGGLLYVGIENRIGWDQIRGTRDHSGLPYTSLLPRFAARWVCRRSMGFRTELNHGYRTYTYSYYGYRRLFRRAGLEIESTWIAPLGYNLPTRMVPLNKTAIDLQSRRWIYPPIGWRDRVVNQGKRWLARPSVWRTFGSDFTFLLRPLDA